MSLSKPTTSNPSAESRRQSAVFISSREPMAHSQVDIQDAAMQAVKTSIYSEQHQSYLSQCRQRDLVDGFARRRAAGVIQRVWRSLLLTRKTKRRKKGKASKKGKPKGVGAVRKK